MAVALDFPIPQEDGEKVSFDNGLTYYWDQTQMTWVLFSSQNVNKNYVDTRDELRLRKDGSDFMYGNLRVREEPSSKDDQIKLSTTGVISLRDKNTLRFESSDRTKGYITYGLENAEFVMFEFDADYIEPHTTMLWSTDDDIHILNKIDNRDASEEFILFDCFATRPSIATRYSVHIIANSNQSFDVVAGDNYDDIFQVNGLGQVLVTCNQKDAFIVTNEASESDPPFKVDAVTHKLMASKEYSTALVAGRGEATSNDGVVRYDYQEPNLIATKEYVDENKVVPGIKIVADREEDAVPGGFWQSGGNLFLKIN